MFLLMTPDDCLMFSGLLVTVLAFFLMFKTP